MPTARSNLEVNVVDGKIYVMGGDPDQTLNYAYDPATDSWTVKAPVPNIATGYERAETSAASATVDGKIYWIGIVGFFEEIPDMVILNQVYDPKNDSWSQRSSPPHQLPGPLPEGAAVTTGVWAPKRIYLYGPNYTRYVYDPATDTWTFARRAEPTRSECGVAVVDDKIYLIGGAYFYTAADLNQQYTPYGYGTVGPKISTSATQNATFSAKDSLVFTTNKPVTSFSYSLDGQTNTTFSGNLTLKEIPTGQHTITVYATDTLGNIGTSDTLHFNIIQETQLNANPTDSLQTLLLVSAIIAVAVAVGGLAFYFKGHKQART